MSTDPVDFTNESAPGEMVLSASGKVIEYIKNQIIFRKIKPGDKLPTEPELGKLISVSRTAVREAIKILESSNIVYIKRGDGTYISDIIKIPIVNQLLFKALLQNVSNSDLEAFRDAIELEVVRFTITNASDHEINQLKDSHKTMIDYVISSPDNFTALHQQDINFHTILANLSKNELLKDTYLSVMDIFSPLILRNYQIGQAGVTAISTHALLIHAIERRDLFAASRAIHESVKLCSDWVKIAQEKSEPSL